MPERYFVYSIINKEIKVLKLKRKDTRLELNKMFLDTALKDTTLTQDQIDQVKKESTETEIYLNKLKKRKGTNKKKSAIQERIDMLEIMFGSKFITIAPNNWFNYNSGDTFSPPGIKTSFFTYI